MTGRVIHVDFAKKSRVANIEADSAVSTDPILAEIILLLSPDALLPLPQSEPSAPMPAKVSLRDIGEIIEKNSTDAATAMETMRTGSEALAALSAKLLEDTKLLAESLRTVSDLIGELASRVSEHGKTQAAEG